jgi:predicted MFS family arabinose efflux permease
VKPGDRPTAAASARNGDAVTLPPITEDFAPVTAPTPFPWWPILVLGLAWFLGVAIELSPTGLLTQIASDLEVSISAAGSLTTFFALGNALLVIPLTAYALRFARRPTLIVVMLLLVVSTVIVAVAPTLLVANAGRFLGGAAYGLICTLFPAVVVRLAGPGNAIKGMTVVFTATSLGMALGAPIASLTGNAVGWRLTFLAAAMPVMIAGILMSFVIPQMRDSHHENLTAIQTARLSGVLKVAIGWALIMLAHFVVLTYIDAYLQQISAPPYATSIALFLIGTGAVIGTLLIGHVSSRSLFAALLTAPALVAAGFAVLILGGSNLVVALIGIGLWGIGTAAAVVVYQQALLMTGARAPETAISIGVVLVQGGFAIGATIGGVTIDLVGTQAIPLVALVFVVAAIILAAPLRPVIRGAQNATVAQAPILP